MCQYCNDLDDYEARHGHRCDEDCATYCEVCDEPTCAYEMVTINLDGIETGVCVECEDLELSGTLDKRLVEE